MSGIKATLTSVNAGTRTVTIMVTMYTAAALHAVSQSTGMGTLAYGINAIDWGDGVVVGNTANHAVVAAPNNAKSIFRRSFSHTYPNTAARTIRVGSGCCGGYTTNGTFHNFAGNSIVGTVTPSGAKYIAAFTNTLPIAFAPGVPAAPPTALFLLAAALSVAGMLVLRLKRRSTA